MGNKNRMWAVFCLVVLAGACAGVLLLTDQDATVAAAPSTATGAAGTADAADYMVLAWNDLGMHCYNRDFTDLAVLPPYNTLWAQVIRVGDPPQVVTAGLAVTFFFPDNTYSVGKSNFWDVSPYREVQNAQWLFGLSTPLPDDRGLTGVGLDGTMELRGDYFIAEGIPLTEFRDSAPSTPYPYQLATIVVHDVQTGQELARTRPVAPVSTEMHCDYCHYDNGPGNDDFAFGVVEQNILAKHDDENMDDYPPDLEGPLMDRRPVLCAWCHASNALGAPGVQGIPNLSEAMHEQHDGLVPDTLEGCYNCHPGPQTQCLRDIMSSSKYQVYCVDCHGTMFRISQNPEPWLNEPRCDDARCHGSAYRQDQALYQHSKEHGGVYCEGCHDSPHAIAPSRQSNDAIKFVSWQGYPGPLRKCTVCHTTWPTGPGPHGLTVPPPSYFYLPLVFQQ